MAVATLHERLEDAVQATVAYADLFDFPLEPAEIWRDLIGVEAGWEMTRATIERLVVSGALAPDPPYVVLAGRVGLAGIRRERRERAARLWPTARRLGASLGGIPFARLVALTGSLAAENPDDGADLDYLIVTAPGRLWLVRAMAVALVRLVRPARISVCPNYLLTTRALRLDHQDLFTAHELLQAAPTAGSAVYREMLEQNPWAERWLPNRYRRAMAASVEPSVRAPIQRVGESLLAGPLGDRLEAWEAGRKRARLGSAGGTARFTADTCEGHYGHHRSQVLDEFRARCGQLGIAPPVEQDPGDPEPAFDRADRDPTIHGRPVSGRASRGGLP